MNAAMKTAAALAFGAAIAAGLGAYALTRPSPEQQSQRIAAGHWEALQQAEDKTEALGAIIRGYGLPCFPVYSSEEVRQEDGFRVYHVSCEGAAGHKWVTVHASPDDFDFRDDRV